MELLDIFVPDEQEGTKAIVRSWLVKVGQQIAENDPLVELETDKVTQEIPAPAAGTLVEIILETDAEAVPGALLGRMEIRQAEADDRAASAISAPCPASASASTPAAHMVEAASSSESGETESRLSPSVRRALRGYGYDPSMITGTGKNGRITRADVEKAATSSAARRGMSTAHTASPAPAHLPPNAGGTTSIPHDRMRKTIAESMLNSVAVAPHVTAVVECDLTAIMAHRRSNKSAFEREGANLTLTAYFLAAAADAMQVAPAINSRWYDDRLDLYEDVNIGVGTALGDMGLVVPVVRQCQRQSLLGIAQNLTDLTTRARSGQIKPADMRDGTFTISNHGVSGSLIASPIIIRQPQSAILGIGKTEKRVVVREVDRADALQIRPIAYASLTIDHRVVDGYQTNVWLSKFTEVLESWDNNKESISASR